jgi:hypothetical protein
MIGPNNYTFDVYMNYFEDIVNTNSIFLFLIILSGALFLSCIITSNIINFKYNDDIERSYYEYINTLDNEYDEDYIYKYDDLFDESKIKYIDYEMKENDKKLLKDKFITEKTPKGDVIMSYNYCQSDTSLSSFYYYCNDCSIQYAILETVAKKYVCENKCLFFFITNDKTIDNGNINNEENQFNYSKSDKEKNTDNKTSNIFANFRNYNKKTSSSNFNLSNNKNVNDNNTNVFILKNRFTRIGTINDYNDMINKNNFENNREKTIQNISFSDFKNKK